MLENPVALFLWASGLALFLWKPETDRAHLLMCGIGVAIWLALAVWLPVLRNWPYMFLTVSFSAVSVFRFVQHRSRSKSILHRRAV